MANPDLPPGALQKRSKGTARLEALSRSDSRKAAEDRAKRTVRTRDKKCRRPSCPHCKASKGRLLLHVAHLTPKGLGGDPKGLVTTANQMIRVDAKTHDEQERGLLEITPIDAARGTDGDCAWWWIGDGSLHPRLEGIA